MNTNKDFALKCDQIDPLQHLRREFIFPQTNTNKDITYLCGNSLGLQPKICQQLVQDELNNWATYAVEGHFKSAIPWFSYHESVRNSLANIMGAKPHEVVAMNGLSVNLHLLMVSFYKPTKTKFKIMIESSAFPSDRYAVMSQLKFHGIDIEEGLIEIAPFENSELLTTQQILQTIDDDGDSIALILFSGVQYLTGQCFDMQAITKSGHAKDIIVGFDLAHAAGNIKLKLHDWDVDFAAWCSYKYLNSGPGGIAGSYIHERHCNNKQLNRFAGWWGNDPSTRFNMPHEFEPIKSADAWQLSNPPIFQLAALNASLKIFAKTSIDDLRIKGDKQTQYIIFLLNSLLANKVNIITPKKLEERGNQLSLKLKSVPKEVQNQLSAMGVITDFREPDILRLAVAPLYTSYYDCYNFVKSLQEIVG